MIELPKGLAEGSPLYQNTYECPCGNAWEDQWDCGCDDDCAACGSTISPTRSELKVLGAEMIASFMQEFPVGSRIVVTHPTMGRTYGTCMGVQHTAFEEQPVLDVQADGYVYRWKAPAGIVEIARCQRDMDIGDLLNLDMLKAAIEVPFLGSLWTEGDSGMMTPHVCKASFGDGMYLLTISTIHQRPNYWVVRVDSSWREARYGYHWFRESSVGDHIDDVLTAIEEECGRAGECLEDPCDNCDDTTCKCSDDYSADEAFPELDDRDGCSWGHIRWNWLMRAIGMPDLGQAVQP